MKTTLLALAIACAMPAVALAHGDKPHAHGAASVQIGTLDIAGAWARATPPRAPVGGAYLVITNSGSEPDRLIGGTARAGETISIHEMVDQEGRMMMRSLTEGLEIPAGATVELAPGAHHLMVEGLTSPLVEGASVTLNLVFEKAGTVQVPFDIKPMRARAGQGKDAAKDGCPTEGGHHHSH